MQWANVSSPSIAHGVYVRMCVCGRVGIRHRVCVCMCARTCMRACELRPSTANGKGDVSLATIGRCSHRNTPVCQVNQRPDSVPAGLQQVDEGRVSPAAGRWRREPSSPTASYYYYMVAEVESKALPSNLMRWRRLTSPRNDSTEDQPVSTQARSSTARTSRPSNI